MENNTKEIRVGESIVYLDEENIAHVTAVGEVDDNMAKLIEETFIKLINNSEDSIIFFIDLNKAGKPSPKARQMFKELGIHKKTKKVALYGIHPVAKIIATFCMNINFNKGNIRFFTTKKEAFEWIME